MQGTTGGGTGTGAEEGRPQVDSTGNYLLGDCLRRCAEAAPRCWRPIGVEVLSRLSHQAATRHAFSLHATCDWGNLANLATWWLYPHTDLVLVLARIELYWAAATVAVS